MLSWTLRALKKNGYDFSYDIQVVCLLVHELSKNKINLAQDVIDEEFIK